jgi:chaperonin GroES
MLSYKTLNGRVLIQEIKEENKTATGIIIPDQKGKIKLSKGLVKVVDKSIATEVLKEGDVVFFRQGIGYEVTLPDEGTIKPYLIIPATNLELVQEG